MDRRLQREGSIQASDTNKLVGGKRGYRHSSVTGVACRDGQFWGNLFRRDSLYCRWKRTFRTFLLFFRARTGTKYRQRMDKTSGFPRCGTCTTDLGRPTFTRRHTYLSGRRFPARFSQSGSHRCNRYAILPSRNRTMEKRRSFARFRGWLAPYRYGRLRRLIGR